MTVDILDPGPAGDFPHLPRTVDGYLDTTRVPVGLRRQPTPEGGVILVDVTPTVRHRGRVVPVTDVVPAPSQ